MNEKSGYRGWCLTRSRLLVVRTTAARCGVVTTFIALILFVNPAAALGTPLQQPTTNAAVIETPPNSDTTSDASRMAAIVAVVNRQGTQGPENLMRVSSVAVSNLMTEPALVVDARAKRAAEAEAAAAKIALIVQAAVEAEEAEAARKAAALAATQEAEAAEAASATAAAIASEIARASAAEAAALDAAAALAARQEARVRAAEVAATRTVVAPAATVVSDPKAPDRMSSLLIALTPMLGGVLGLRLWRLKREPFVLKANSTPARSSTPA